MGKYRVLKDCMYYDFIFDAIETIDDIIKLDTFDGIKEFKTNDVKKIYKKEFYILNNKTNKLIKTIKAYDREDASSQINNKNNIRIITKNKYLKEQELIKEDRKKREELLKKGIHVRALDTIK
ncbi:hypothetical protein C672_3507 [[Clostridium] bifermentans ATCC 638]|uniref:Uncharacterized protein n=1 Tax=Paraclostridium bifermentans ATCC 638 = DSM 14991 TaxID=1233171 RepID=T4VGV7_PARBF|nr:hypothetical protein [Paraclostridium bifermentans]EQK39996.1 hypothetical protein C672_3507 [[Clostridium] bifermentans ATCC 638] [Paraclostridium bifermentans ATCC 638 = DSM 14991]RIZ57507.1 hypothetical protein CHH45_16060 [Paraclostridium bifermentans]UAG19975.1 hypothetical protein KXZ80_16995 [Paraclostridium bifermentans]